MILVLDPDSESDFQLFADSGSRFRFNKKWNCNTSMHFLSLLVSPACVQLMKLCDAR